MSNRHLVEQRPQRVSGLHEHDAARLADTVHTQDAADRQIEQVDPVGGGVKPFDERRRRGHPMILRGHFYCSQFSHRGHETALELARTPRPR
jgi:hypothetical protein